MHHDRVDFSDAIYRNAVALLQRQRMICGLKLDQGSKSMVAKVSPCLQVYSLWVGLKPAIQPTEERAYM